MTALKLAGLALLLTLVGGCTALQNAEQAVSRLATQRGLAQSGSVDGADVAAIKAVIGRANDAQAKAFATGDPSVMKDTATVRHYDEMVQVNRDLARSGTRSIALVSLAWGEVDVTGATARATTNETWRSTFADGTTEESTNENDYSLVRAGSSWLIDADDQPGAETTVPGFAPAPNGQRPATNAVVGDTSSNWSGYAATGGTFTAVSASWTVPTVASGNGVEATWVGIGGVASRDLIQAGTQSLAQRGAVTYTAWIETLPRGAQTVALRVQPGDQVSVSISAQPGDGWLIAMQDQTSGQSYRTTVTYASSRSSAEWIEEAPSSGRSVLPLDDFGTVAFTDATATKDGRALSIAALDGRAITMIDHTRAPLAVPSALGRDGRSFSVTRTQTPSTSGSSFPIAPRRRG